MPRAAADAEQNYERISTLAPIAGQRWYNRLIASLDSLSDNPERCTVVPYLSTSTHTVRQLLYGRRPHLYKVYLDVAGDTVRVLHIRHSARKEPSREELLG